MCVHHIKSTGYIQTLVSELFAEEGGSVRILTRNVLFISGHVATFKHANVGLAGLFIGLGEIVGEWRSLHRAGGDSG